MRKPFFLAVAAIAAGTMILGIAQAQQTPPAGSSQTPPAKTTKPPAAKTGTTTTARKPAVLTLKTDKDKESYAIGLNMGQQMHKDSVDIDTSILLRGMRDGLAGGKVLMTDEEVKAAMDALRTDLRAKQEAKLQQESIDNKTEGDKFLPTTRQRTASLLSPAACNIRF